MKKIFLACAIAGTVLGFTSCSETWDDNPVVKTHEGTIQADFLNEPTMMNEEIIMTEQNSTGTLHLTCSQPDFGYAAVATYRVQCSLTEDFKNLYEIKQDFYDCAQINPLNFNVARAVETLSGVQTEADLPLAPRKVYMRLRAFISQTPDDTQYISNVVSFAGIGADYFNMWIVGEKVDLYMRGGMNEWGTSPDWQFEQDEDDDTWILKNVTIAAGVEFKVADTGWRPINIGGNTIPVGTKTMVNCDSNSTNMKLDKDFTGDVKLSYTGGNYYILFNPAKK